MNEHLIKLAERFGMSHKETAMDRRTFLKGLLATGALVATPSGLLMPREAKIHQVGGEIREPEFVNGVAEIRLPNGQKVTLRDFREDDKWDTVEIKNSYGSGNYVFGSSFEPISEGEKLESLIKPDVLHEKSDLTFDANPWKFMSQFDGAALAALHRIALAGK